MIPPRLRHSKRAGAPVGPRKNTVSPLAFAGKVPLFGKVNGFLELIAALNVKDKRMGWKTQIGQAVFLTSRFFFSILLKPLVDTCTKGVRNSPPRMVSLNLHVRLGQDASIYVSR